MTRCASPRSLVAALARDDGLPAATGARRLAYTTPTPQHFLYFLPLPQGHRSLRPTLGTSRTMVLILTSPWGWLAASPISPPAAGVAPPTASAVARTFSPTP